MVYLFIGEDSLSKDTLLKKIRNEHLEKCIEQFNLDIIYAEELTLKGLQERLFYLPIKNSKRIVIIKNAQDLKIDAKEFILNYVKKPPNEIILILDISHQENNDEFINRLYGYAKTYRFKQIKSPDTFTLSRLILLKKTTHCLQILKQLLKANQRPERILGGLRYIWEKERMDAFEMRNRLKLLLDCDMEIKTGKVKPTFALEKLIINLCAL